MGTGNNGWLLKSQASFGHIALIILHLVMVKTQTNLKISGYVLHTLCLVYQQFHDWAARLTHVFPQAHAIVLRIIRA